MYVAGKMVPDLLDEKVAAASDLGQD